MKIRVFMILAAMGFMTAASGLRAQVGPFTNTDWPPTIASTNMVSYGIFDTNASTPPNDPATFFPTTPANGNWTNSLFLAGGGDQAIEACLVDGFNGQRMVSSFLNIGDSNYLKWAQTPQLDILLQMYGDDSLFTVAGAGKAVQFHIGIAGSETSVNGAFWPAGARNLHWNWVLLTFTNPVSPNLLNTNLPLQRYLGFDPAPGSFGFGGLNGGTVRIQNQAGLSIRAAALGPAGSFGLSNAVNVFGPAPPCIDEPTNANLAYVDINLGITNNLIILDGGDQAVTTAGGIGPAGDLRTAIKGTQAYVNTAVLNNYLGAACNPIRDMKVCVEFYEDPANIGSYFCPESFAINSSGSVAKWGPFNASAPPSQLAYTNRGSGTWVKVAFWIPSANLAGINVDTNHYPGTNYTGVARLGFSGTVPWIDRIEMGVLRIGSNPLAGRDPDPGFFTDPLVCTTNYHNFSEVVLGIYTNGMSIGGTADSPVAGPDQRRVVEYYGSTNVNGSTNDFRLSVRPAHGDAKLLFRVSNQFFGPVSQDNLDLAVVLTYYDDPALIGAAVFPQAYLGYIGFVNTIFLQPPAPYNTRVVIQGTGKWRDAYFEIPNVNFASLQSGPAAITFATSRAVQSDTNSGNIHISRVRFDVIRPCGVRQGINLLQSLSVVPADTNVSVTFRGQATLQGSAFPTGPFVDLLSTNNNVSNTVVLPQPPFGPGYFRLKYPAFSVLDVGYTNGGGPNP